jgi:hypothetical protein
LSCLLLVSGAHFCVSILSPSPSFLDENCVVGWLLRGLLRLL